MINSIIKFIALVLLSTYLIAPINSWALTDAEAVLAAQAEKQAQANKEAIDNGLTSTEGFATELKRSIDALTNGIDSFSKNTSGQTGEIATKLLMYLSLISISLTGFQLALTSGSLSEPMNRLVSTIFTIGFTYYLISPEGYDLFVKTGIDKSMDTLATMIMPGGSATVSDGFTNLMQKEFEFLFKGIDKLSAMSWWEKLTDGAASIILLAFAMLAFMFLALIGIIAALSALISVAIGLALGPIFIPFLVLEKTSFLFDGWVKFMINASLTKVIVAVLLAIGTAGFQGVLDMNGGSLIASMLGGLVLAGTLAQMMLSAPQIASSLTSGGSTGGLQFGAKAMKTLQGAGSNAAGATGGAAGRALGNKVGMKVDSGAGRGTQALQKLGQQLRSNDFSANNTKRLAEDVGRATAKP